MHRRRSTDSKSQERVVLFHGTSTSAAAAIKQRGFRSSTSGQLGAGVYLASQRKAENFARDAKRRGKGDGAAVLKCEAVYHNAKFCDTGSDAWLDEGYDAIRVNSTNLSVSAEWCFKDPSQVTVLAVYELNGDDFKPPPPQPLSRSPDASGSPIVAGAVLVLIAAAYLVGVRSPSATCTPMTVDVAAGRTYVDFEMLWCHNTFLTRHCPVLVKHGISREKLSTLKAADLTVIGVPLRDAQYIASGRIGPLPLGDVDRDLQIEAPEWQSESESQLQSQSQLPFDSTELDLALADRDSFLTRVWRWASVPLRPFYAIWCVLTWPLDLLLRLVVYFVAPADRQSTSMTTVVIVNLLTVVMFVVKLLFVVALGMFLLVILILNALADACTKRR